jgi:hypothetical protein
MSEPSAFMAPSCPARMRSIRCSGWLEQYAGGTTAFSISIKTILRVHNLLILLGWFSILTACAQQEFRGPLMLDDLQGDVHFHYRLAGNDTILHGPWTFRASSHDSITDGFKSHVISGSHTNGARSGEWMYKATDFHMLEEARVEGYQLVRKATGWEYAVTGSFEGGRAAGNWQVVRRKITGGEIEDEVFAGRISYANGHPTGELKGSASEISVTGSFNSTGFLHGEWRATHQKPRQLVHIRRVYDNGRLTGQFLITNGREYEIAMAGTNSVTGDEETLWDELPVNNKYFKILEYTTIGPSPEVTQRSGMHADSTMQLVRRSNELMSDIILAFSQHDDRPIWEMLPGGPSFEPARARVRRHPLSAEEHYLLDELTTNHSTAKEITERLIRDPRVEVAGHAAMEIASDLAMLRVLDQRLNSMEPLIEILGDPAIEYLDRDRVIGHLTPRIEYPREITFPFQEGTQTINTDLPSDLILADADLPAINEHLKKVRKAVEEHSARANRILADQELSHALGDKEQRLVQLRDSILTLYSDTANNEYQRGFAAAMEKLALHGFSDYAAAPDAGTRTDRIDTLLQCYEDAIHTYHRQSRIPQRLQQLDELYTRTIFNPYTFTYMDERMKERLYKAYEDILLPYVLDDAQRNITCDHIRSKQENIVRLYQKMMDLWEQDTSDISQRLRRVSDPRAIMEILSLDLDLN